MQGAPTFTQAAHGLAMAQRMSEGRLLGRCCCGAEWQVESFAELRAAMVAHQGADDSPDRTG